MFDAAMSTLLGPTLLAESGLRIEYPMGEAVKAIAKVCDGAERSNRLQRRLPS